MNENEIYRQLSELTKDKSRWEESIPDVSAYLDHESVKIKAKALWLLGEMGLLHPDLIKDALIKITPFLDSKDSLLRERAINALGRIGRGDFNLVEPYIEKLFEFSLDDEAKVRLSFIWASENIATNTPDIYKDHMDVFEKLLHDENDKVRMEAPEIFRVLGKRRAEFVLPYIQNLKDLAENDENRVVRIHSLGAIKATGK